MRTWGAAAALVLLLGEGTGVSVEAADLTRGRALYENHCVVCHTPGIHKRPNRIVLTLEELRQIVSHWAQQENLRWSREDIADVVWYLNETKYRY